MTVVSASNSRHSGLFLALLGTVGLVASFTLIVERFRILTQPGYQPSCSINPIISCGSVMVTRQAAVFGFPNPLLGIVGFTVVGLTGLILASGVPLPRWYRVGFLLGATVAAVFISWLVYQSLYQIGALCPYCMVVWIVTISTLAIAARLARTGKSAIADQLIAWRWILAVLWFVTVITLIYVRFSIYWDSLV
ncbi:MAG: vitamin K epoxide reductase family protein [Nocardiaceae bacterium]|nr:vitamin K epoxide reductase family protein [Nocardiaceae bacterium]